MAVGMAPPVKKRRLSKSTFWNIFAPERHIRGSEATATLSHVVESIGPSQTELRPSPTKVHVEIRREVQREPVYPIPGKVYGRIGKRQDATGVTTDTSTDNTDITSDGSTGVDETTSTVAGGGGNNAVSALAAGFSTPPVLDTSTNTTETISATSTAISATVGAAGVSSAAPSSSLTSAVDLSSATSNSSSTSTTETNTRSSTGTSTRSGSGSPTTTSNARSSSASRIATISVQQFSTTNSDGVTSVYFVTASPSNADDAQSTVYSTAIISPTNVNAGAAAGQDSSSTATSSASLSASNGGGNNSSPPASTVAGGVVGGVAGLAVIVLLAMLLLRWYRRRHQQHQALPPAGLNMSRDFNDPSDDVSRGPGMAERAGIMPLMNAMPGMFRHQDRSIHDSTSASVSASAPSERGFTRVAGRKLPSAFSEGANTNASAMPFNAGSSANMSNTSFYRESDPFVDQPDSPPSAGFGGAGVAMTHDRQLRPEQMTMSPGPARKATVHHGGPYVMSPSSSTLTTPQNVQSRGGSGWGSPPPTAGTAGTWNRSETPASLDTSRGSRFMEEV